MLPVNKGPQRWVGPVCYHESGHAAALAYYGIAFDCVTVLLNPISGEDWGSLRSPPSQVRPLRYAAACLAGAAAEGKFTGERLATLLITTARTDREAAPEALSRDESSSSETALNAAQGLARHWRSIGRLARLLMRTEQLTAKQVARLLVSPRHRAAGSALKCFLKNRARAYAGDPWGPTACEIPFAQAPAEPYVGGPSCQNSQPTTPPN